MIALLSFDVEEWFHAVPDFSPDDWSRKPSTIEEEFDLIASRLAAAGRSATFFLLAEVARSHPRILRDIAAAGWEIASHGSGHRRVCNSSPEDFRRSVRTSVRLLEDTTGIKVQGYRAPMWSLTPQTEWAVEILIDEGLEYDSSVIPRGRRDPFVPFLISTKSGSLLEVPPTRTRIGPFFCLLASGVSQRLFPQRWYQALLCREAERHGFLHLYLHPWEISPRRRSLDAIAFQKRLYFNTGRRRACAKFPSLLRQFPFSSIASQMPSLRSLASRTCTLSQISCFKVAGTGAARRGEAFT